MPLALPGWRRGEAFYRAPADLHWGNMPTSGTGPAGSAPRSRFLRRDRSGAKASANGSESQAVTSGFPIVQLANLNAHPCWRKPLPRPLGKMRRSNSQLRGTESSGSVPRSCFQTLEEGQLLSRLGYDDALEVSPRVYSPGYVRQRSTGSSASCQHAPPWGTGGLSDL